MLVILDARHRLVHRLHRAIPVAAVDGDLPGLHNKIPAHKIFARVWVAQKSFFLFFLS